MKEKGSAVNPTRSGAKRPGSQGGRREVEFGTSDGNSSRIGVEMPAGRCQLPVEPPRPPFVARRGGGVGPQLPESQSPARALEGRSPSFAAFRHSFRSPSRSWALM